MEKYGYRFSVGPWTIHDGADGYGPAVRQTIATGDKFKLFKQIGFDAVQLFDEDAVPKLDSLTPEQIASEARATKKRLEGIEMVAEYVSPNLWVNPITIDGAFTSNDPAARMYAIDRTKKAIDIANELGTDLIVLTLVRDGTYMRESKDPVGAIKRFVGAVNECLSYDPNIRIAIEPKPYEPMDIGYVPTVGHALTLGHATFEPDRVGVLVESAHAWLTGLDPSDEMAFALSLDKLWAIHLNDQNGMKYDQDRTFGMANLRAAFNQVRTLDVNGYIDKGYVGFDVRALRTQPAERAVRHLQNSLEMFSRMVRLTRSMNLDEYNQIIAARDYEALDMVMTRLLMGG